MLKLEVRDSRRVGGLVLGSCGFGYLCIDTIIDAARSRSSETSLALGVFASAYGIIAVTLLVLAFRIERVPAAAAACQTERKTMLNNPPRHSLGVEVTGLVMMSFAFVWYGLGAVLGTAYGVFPGALAVVMNVVAAACGIGLVITWRNFVRAVRTPRVVPTAQARRG